MIKLFSKNISLFLMIGLSWSAISMIGETQAYFNDTEISKNNTYQAGTLDFSLGGNGFNVYDFEEGDTVETTINIIKVSENSLGFQYTIHTSTTGELCNDLKLSADLLGQDEIKYDNVALAGFSSSDITIVGDWKFTVSLPSDAHGICNFDFVFQARQQNLNYGNGFFDEEKISNVISTCNAPDHIVINEVQIANTEFIELYNPTKNDVDMTGWHWCYFSSNRDWNNPYRDKEFHPGATIPAQGFYLIATTSDEFPNADWNLEYASHFLSDTTGSIAIFPSDSPYIKENRVDAVAWGNVNYVKENSESIKPNESQSIERNPIGCDSDDNSVDFIINENPTPTNSDVE